MNSCITQVICILALMLHYATYRTKTYPQQGPGVQSSTIVFILTVRTRLPESIGMFHRLTDFFQSNNPHQSPQGGDISMTQTQERKQ